ncbi:MAG: GNAT family N-acetyltransferase [Bacteroidota bacterium]
MNISIRLAVPSDVSIIAEFNTAMAKETEGIELNRERLRKGVEALFADPSKGLYYITESNGKIAGQLMITYEWSDWRNAAFWWIQSVYVRPEYRRHGVFRALYRYIETIARTRGDVCGVRLYVDQSNERAQKTYESLDMRRSHYQMMEMDLGLK